MSWWDTVGTVPNPDYDSTPPSQGNGGSGVDPTEVVRQAYLSFLGREPSDEEVRSHLRRSSDLNYIVLQIRNSPEALSFLGGKPYSQTGQGAGSGTGTGTGTGSGTGSGSNTGSGSGKEPPEGWAAWFKALTNGKPPTPAQLIALESELAKYGVKVIKNSAGIAGKIQLPNGKYIDVIQGASRGGEAWQWADADEAGGATGASTAEKWDREFGYRDWTPPPEFVAPSAESVLNDQGFRARLAEGQKAIERSAAAKGTLLTGGTVKGLQQFSQDYASNEYQNAWNREKSAYDTRYGNRLSDYSTNYSKDRDAYNTAYNQWAARDTNAFNRPYMLAQLGFNAASTRVPSGGA